MCGGVSACGMVLTQRDDMDTPCYMYIKNITLRSVVTLSFFNDDDSGIEEPPPRLGRAAELRGGAGEVSNSSSTAI